VVKKVSILSSGGAVSRARLHRLANALIAGGLEVHIWAPGKSSDAPTGAIFHKTLPSKSKVSRVIRDLTLPFQARGDAILTISPDIVPISFVVAKIRGKKLITDINEDYLKLLEDRDWATGLIGVMARSIARFANKLAARGDLLIVADSQVPPFQARKRMVVKNFPDATMVKDSGEMEKVPRAIYIGDIRKSRGLYSMLQIAELAPKWNFDFVGPIAAADEEYVERWRAISPAAPRVKFHGALAPNKSWEFARGAWVGLSLLESTPAFNEAVPSKLYEYSFAGLAVLSSPLPRCIELINQSGGGVISQSEAGAANILNSWAQNPEPLLSIRNKAKVWARQTLAPDEQYLNFRQAVEKL
jgi:hypothetical protein